MAEPRARRDGWISRLMVWIAITAAVLDDLLYIAVIRSQSERDPQSFTEWFVGGFIALMAALLATSLLNRPLIDRLRPSLRGAAAGGLLVLGVLGAFSIGLPLFIAGVLTVVVAIRTLAGRRAAAALTEIAAAALTVAVLVAGFEATERLIACPAKGFMSGGGYGLLSGGYHWTCVDGHLDFRSGFCSSGGGGVDANGHAFATNSC